MNEAPPVTRTRLPVQLNGRTTRSYSYPPIAASGVSTSKACRACRGVSSRYRIRHIIAERCSFGFSQLAGSLPGTSVVGAEVFSHGSNSERRTGGRLTLLPHRVSCTADWL